MPRKPILTQFGLHLGEIIKHDADMSKYSQKELADKMKLSHRAFLSKFKSPHFGTIYDIIKISMILDKDYFTYPQAILNSNGIESPRIYSTQEYDQLKETLLSVEEVKERYERIIDKLSNK